MNRAKGPRIFASIMLVALLALTCITLLPEASRNAGGWGVKPLDDVDGAYVQYLEGSWFVTSDQTFTSEKIDLTGDLVIYDGATLTLKGTTLRFNCSSAGEFGIDVQSGGALEVLDKDGYAATWGDESVLTDGVLDTDDFSDSDYGYTFECAYDSSLTIRNSKVDNAGVKGGKFSSGITLSRTYTDIQNTTFHHLLGGLEANYFDSLHLANITMKNVWGDSLNANSGMEGGALDLEYSHFENAGNITLSAAGSMTVRECSFVSTSLRMGNCDELRFHDCSVAGGVETAGISATYVERGSIADINMSCMRSWASLTIFESSDISLARCQFYRADHGLVVDYSQGISVQDSSFSSCNTSIYVASTDGLSMTNTSILSSANEGIYLSYDARNITCDGVLISGCNKGMIIYPSTELTVWNSVVTGCVLNAKVFYDANLSLVHCTANMSLGMFDLYTNAGYWPPQVHIKEFLQARVSDTKGAIANAKVEGRNRTGVVESFSYTDASGRADMVLSNATLTDSGTGPMTVYHGPFDIVASISGKSATSPTHPSMSGPANVNISFGFDTPPGPAQDLRTYTEGDSVVLDWECYSSDYRSFLVYRNTTAGFTEIYNSTGTLGQNATRYLDLHKAASWWSYRYYVRLFDSAGNLGSYDTIVRNGDWVVLNNQTVGARTIRMNGTISVLGGHLLLKGTQVAFNSTFTDSQAEVRVGSGGWLEIADTDNDPGTDNGAYLYGAETGKRFSIHVLSGGKLTVSNSKFKDLGKGYSKNGWEWYNSPALDYGAFYIQGRDCSIKNVVLREVQVPITASGAKNLTIEGVELSKGYEKDVIIQGCDQVTFKGCRFNGSVGHKTGMDYLYIGGCTNVTIQGCTFAEMAMGAFYLNDSTAVRIQSNTFDRMFTSGGFGEIFRCYRLAGAVMDGNQVTNTTGNSASISIRDVFYLRFSNNKFKSMRATVEMGCDNDDFMTNYDPSRRMAVIENNTFESITNNGPNFEGMRNLVIANNTLKSMPMGGNPALIFWSCDNVLMERNTIQGGWMGIGAVSSDVRSVNTTYQSLTYDVGVVGATTVRTLGGNFNESKTWFLDAEPRIIFQAWVNVTIKDPLGALAPGATLTVSDALGNQIYNGVLQGAKRPWTVVDLRQRYVDSNITLTPTLFTAKLGNHSGMLQTTPAPLEQVNISLQNALPILRQIFIDPPDPITTDDLNLVYEYSDSEKDPEGQTTLRWFKNGVHQPAFDNLTVVPSFATKKMEVWYCQVTPHDTYAYGSPTNTSFVMIKNTLPVVSNLTPAKESFCSDEPLSFNYTFFDLDGDNESGSIYKWYLYNGTGYERVDVPSEPSPPASVIRKGQKWRLEVTPSDGEYGAPLMSDPVEVTNTPPAASSLVITPQLPVCTQDMSISFSYFDHDGDAQNGTLFNWYTNTGSGYKYSGLSTSTIAGRFLTKGEHWKCLVIPYDGSDFGQPVWSKEVAVWNAPPVAYGLSFQPEHPTSGDDITCVYGYLDPDSDAENGTIVEWLLLNTTTKEYEKTGIISKTLQSDDIARGQQWICRVKPSDGANPNGIKSYGDSVVSASLSIGNSKPVAKDLRITPDPPNATSALSLGLSTFDRDPGDAVTVKEIRWYRDGAEVKALANSLDVASGTCKRGERWKASVVLSDGLESSEALFAPEVVVSNFRPVVTSLRIVDGGGGAVLRTGSQLLANVTSFDADGDTMSDPMVRWYRNDEEQTAFADQLTVPDYATSKDDFWYVEVACFDGSEYGPMARSEPVRIQNTGPAITTFSPSSASWSMNEGENQTFSVAISDPDQDMLFFKWYLSDKAVGDHNSFVFSPDYLGAGEYFLNVSCQDVGSGAQTVFHYWTITVANVNRAPVVDILEPMDTAVSMDEGNTQRFRVSVQDPDADDNLEVTWYFDGEPVVSNIDTYIHDADYSSSGRHNVTVTASDGRATASRSWELTIKDVDPDANKFLTLTFDKWGIILEAALIVFTVITAIIGVIQYRKKHSYLKAYMKRVKEINEQYSADAATREKALVELRTEVVAKYLKGIIEDNHFLVLEKKLEDSIRKTREYQIAEDLDVNLSLELKDELNDILKDGTVSNKEFASLRLKILNDPGLTSEEKRDMLKLVNSWRMSDKGEKRAAPVARGKDQGQ